MILQRSTQNVNSNAGVFLAKQLLDRMGGFSRFDDWQKAARSVPCQRYSNSSLVKAQVALMSLGKTSFSDIAAHQRDDLFADAIRGDVPSEPTFRQRLGVIGAICGSHGGRRYLRLGRNCHVADVFMAIGARMAA